MVQASAPDVTKCTACGYRPQWKDTFYVKDQDITHVICYGCGSEWVE